MKTLHPLALLVLTLAPAAPLRAGQIIAANSGLPSPDFVEDFGANLFPNFTPITTQFPPLTFAHTRYFTTGSANNLNGGFLTNDFSGAPDTLKILFGQPVTDVSFVYHQINTSQPSVFRVYLGGVLVDSFSNTSDQFQPNNYFGFTDLLFDELQLDFVVDFNLDEVAYNVAGGGGTTACFGDGSGVPCPCGNESAPGAGAGCLNGLGVGAVLSSAGSADTANDTLVLSVTDVTDQPGLFFQGQNLIAGGAGVPFGDGIRCCGGGVLRLQIVDPPAATGPTTASSSVTISQLPNQGGLPGSTRCYQYWYRNPGSSPCGSNFNLSNALTLTWT